MPQMDGWSALKELKADAELRDIPVIMVSVLNERGLAIPLGRRRLHDQAGGQAAPGGDPARALRRSRTTSILVVEDDRRPASCSVVT